MPETDKIIKPYAKNNLFCLIFSFQIISVWFCFSVHRMTSLFCFINNYENVLKKEPFFTSTVINTSH
jgi:hypothetical protein